MTCVENSSSSSNDSRNNCGDCDLLVSWSEQGIACETCGKWFHAKCRSIGSASYEQLGDSDALWFCDICGNQNYSTTMFDLHGTEQTFSFNNSVLSDNSDFKPQHSSTPNRFSRTDKFRGRPLRLLNVNFQSMVSKRAQIIEMIDRLKPDVIIGCETWLKPEIQSSELLTKQYQIFRRDRPGKASGGGVMIAVKTDLQCTEIVELNTDCEIIWVKILTKTQKPIYVSAYYRPDIKDTKALIELENSLRKATKIKNAHMIIAGDFNLPQWDWTNMCLKDDAKYKDSCLQFIDCLYDSGLQQLVLEPTRLLNILDLVLTNTPDLVSRIEVIPGLSDHSIVFFEYNVKMDRKKNALRKIFLYRRANWDKMKTDMRELYDQLKNENLDDVEELWNKFKTALQESMSHNIPQKTTRPRDSYPWITIDIRKKMKKKDRLSKKALKSGNDELKAQHKELRKEIKKDIDREYWNYVRNLFEKWEDESNNQPCLKRFYTYVKHQRSSTTGVAPLKSGGRLVTEPRAKAEILNEQFNKSFSEGKKYSLNDFEQKCKMPNDKDFYRPMPEIEIDQKGIEKLLKNLNPTKACGPDGLSPRVLKELATDIAPILTIIFKSSLRTGIVPQDWRTALVSPVYKKGGHYEPINYRPVSLTCIPCKIMEHVIVSNIMKHLEDQDILCDEQHGFRRKRSCETQLLKFYDDITMGLDNGYPSDVIIMDFAKAFDRVNHSLLVHKLEYYGIQGMVNKWIESFLSDRTQSVVVEGEASSTIQVRSGVPQGSVVGPCLFLLYINDLPNRVSSISKLFADDTLLHRLMKNDNDTKTLQEDLQELEKWENEWDMSFHPNKCNILPISKKKTANRNEYTLHDHQLETVESAKYLGVTLQSNASWDKHIDGVCAKANRTLGFIRRNLKVAPRKTKEIAYKALVRPILEYSSSVWDPANQKQVNTLEKVQRRAARFVCNNYQKKASVNKMLNDLKWPTLQKRREKSRLCMMYKITNGQAHFTSESLKPIQARSGRRGHESMYERVRCKTELRNNTFVPKTIRDWNSLPQATVESATLDTFVSRVTRLQ